MITAIECIWLVGGKRKMQSNRILNEVKELNTLENFHQWKPQ